MFMFEQTIGPMEMEQVTKTQSAGKPAKSAKSDAEKKPRRVLMNTPMKKYIIYHDPHQWDEDMVSAGETN